mgnify:CR=1 FL=1
MHYQHRFHAGNFADVFKHLLLCGLLASLNRKDAPWAYLETHAGAGVYELEAEAQRTGEFRNGVSRLFALKTAPPPVMSYLAQLRTLNAGELQAYPGSPWWAAAYARAQDRLILCEREPVIAADLRSCLGDDARVAIHQRDGYESLGLLPPREKRGLVLIDPPFERPDEFDAVERYLAQALQRFANGVFAIWYPYKKRFDSERFLRRVRASLRREALNCVLDTGAPSEGQMHACGLLIINPPFPFVNEAGPLLDYLAPQLSAGAKPRAQVELWPAKAEKRG